MMLIEAMSQKIPVVSTAIGGIPELLADEAGVLVTPSNSLELSLAIELLI